MENAGIKSIHNTAVAGKKIAVILYSAVALYNGRGKIAKLNNYSRRDSAKAEQKIAVITAHPSVYDKQIHQCDQHSAHHTSNSTRNRLFGGDVGAKLLFAKQL